MFKESVVTTMENEWDVLPKGRIKVVHSVGSVCKFTLNITKSNYTGMFKPGIQTGIVRMGPTGDISGGKGFIIISFLANWSAVSNS